MASPRTIAAVYRASCPSCRNVLAPVSRTGRAYMSPTSIVSASARPRSVFGTSIANSKSPSLPAHIRTPPRLREPIAALYSPTTASTSRRTSASSLRLSKLPFSNSAGVQSPAVQSLPHRHPAARGEEPAAPITPRPDFGETVWIARVVHQSDPDTRRFLDHAYASLAPLGPRVKLDGIAIERTTTKRAKAPRNPAVARRGFSARGRNRTGCRRPARAPLEALDRGVGRLQRLESAHRPDQRQPLARANADSSPTQAEICNRAPMRMSRRFRAWAAKSNSRPRPQGCRRNPFRCS